MLKAELTNMFSDTVSRMQSIKQRMDNSEKKIADHSVALNDLYTRVMEVQCSVDQLQALGTTEAVGERVQDCEKELEAIRAESRAAICAANDVEQYSQHNNIRITGLEPKEGEDCQTTVVSFLNKKLNVSVSTEDIEAAHILPTADSPIANASSSSGAPQ